VDVRNEGGLIVADISNARLPEALQQRLEVLDFATPVKFIDVEPRGANGARLVITPVEGGLFEQVAYQAGNQFTIELQPLTEAEKQERRTAERIFTGERLSLNFQNVEVRQVLQIVADVAQVNMVIDDTVKGEMALRLDNVPWDQALDIILSARNLGKIDQGNVIFIAPASELAKREAAALQAENARIVLAPLVTELIQVNYAKAEDLAQVLRPTGAGAAIVGAQTGSAQAHNTVLSDRGRVTVDPRTNTMLISDAREKIAEIRKLIKTLDVPVRQVLVEGRVVIANDNFSRDLGARFGFTGVRTGSSTFSSTSGSAQATGGQAENVAGGAPPGIPALGDRFNVNLPAAPGNAGRIALAILGADYLVDLELQALQAEGRGEILSNPRVVTADRKEATIKQGFDVPIVIRDSQTGIADVEFIEALLSLVVTPLITPDENVIMDLKINRDEPDFTRLVDGNPTINRREIVTQVQVRNGETVVLGGVYENITQNNTTKVPILGDIPVLGYLFRNSLKQDNKNELLIFITPKTLKEGVAQY
ncbi:MAG: type IV pilus secretin PilQ, partial [Burkholderiales bacterium]